MITIVTIVSIITIISIITIVTITTFIRAGASGGLRPRTPPQGPGWAWRPRGGRGEFREPGYYYFFLSLVLIVMIVVIDILCKSLRFSAKLPQQLRSTVSESRLAKFPRWAFTGLWLGGAGLLLAHYNTIDYTTTYIIT